MDEETLNQNYIFMTVSNQWTVREINFLRLAKIPPSSNLSICEHGMPLSAQLGEGAYSKGKPKLYYQNLYDQKLYNHVYLFN